MKKLNKIMLILTLLLIPIEVLACPHSDRNGNLHLQTYNSDYTVVSMIYPRADYLYSKDVYMDVEGVNLVLYEDDVLKEDFGFAIYQDLTSYYTYYWIVDTDITFGSLEESEDVKITVEGINEIKVDGEGYFLNVGLSSSYSKGLTYLEDDTYQIYYDAVVSDETDNETYLDLISNYEIKKLSDTYDLSAKFMHTVKNGYFYDTEYTDLEELYDKIEFSIASESYDENAVVINLNEIYTDAFIEPTYEDGYYTFTADKTGVYVVAEYIDISEENGYIYESTVEENTDTEVEKDDVLVYGSNDDDSQSNNNFIYIICGLISTVVVVGTIIILNKKEEI